MKRELQVWGVSIHLRSVGRQCRTVVAATSRNEAALLLGCSSNYLKDFGSVTGNPTEVAVAMAKPRTLFYTLSQNIGKDYLEIVK